MVKNCTVNFLDVSLERNKTQIQCCDSASLFHLLPPESKTTTSACKGWRKTSFFSYIHVILLRAAADQLVINLQITADVHKQTNACSFNPQTCDKFSNTADYSKKYLLPFYMESFHSCLNGLVHSLQHQ